MVSSTWFVVAKHWGKPLTLSEDASSKGLGAVLHQDGKPLVYVSRALTPTQQRYAYQLFSAEIRFVCHVPEYPRVPEFPRPTSSIPTSPSLTSLSLQVPKSSRPRVFTSPSLRVPRPTSPRPTSPRPMFPRPTSPSLTSPSLTSPSLTSPVPVPVSLFVSLILLTRLLSMRSLKNTAHVSK